ncbi:hypothetical protein FUA23_20595 [Neolewinella aurantiaca]|uniref:Uncharacterized protein n=1 Tax=Neolewinella aurantiaca TaxID=2602767 RepID=A0A5C7FGL5_9BACT|nr:hypothetical protein [Neolewinella aurantiaca]TXF85414.1 hypothetical protein FUA23_20595 [Neolewinella aurantiaca]
MSSRNKIWFSVSLVVLLTLSGLSFGFLVGQSQQAQAKKAQEKIQIMTEQVKAQASGALVNKGADAIRRILIK